MTDTELIAQQTRENAELKLRVSELEEAVRLARLSIYCIGGPLNDNRNLYNNHQLREWYKVANQLDI